MSNALKQTLVLAALSALTAPAVATPAQVNTQAAREKQWLYRDVLGNGDSQPTAVFLAWDYSTVIFTVKCDNKTGELVLQTERETGQSAPAIEPIEITSNTLSAQMRTTFVGGVLEGRTELTAELSRILRSKGDLEVFVPTEMGEPLYVGHAGALRRVGLKCGR